MSFYSIPDSEVQEIYRGMEQAEVNGFFNRMFIGECRSPELPSKEKLLQSIGPGMKLYKSFFMKVYGYSIYDPGFKDEAIRALNKAGCTKAADYYADIVNTYQKSRENATKGIGKRLIEEIDRNYEKMCREAQGRGEEQRRQKEIQNLTRSELTELCQKLLQEGVITSPEQFATMV